EILGSVDGKEVVLQEATVTVKNCITIVEVKQRYCAGPDGGSIDWTLRNDGKEEVYILAKTGDRDLLTTLLAPGAETGMLAVALPAGDYPVTFTVENQEGRRVLGTRTVTVSECPVVVAKATITRDDCFSGKATFDNSGSNVAVTYRVWDGQKKIAETKVGAGKSGTAKYTFTGRQLKVTAVDDGNDLTVVSQDFAEACEALAKPIKVKAECGHVTFTSPAGNGPVTVEYGTRDRRSPDGRFSLTGGKAKTVDTQRSEIDWVAYTTVDGKTVTQQIQDDLPVKDCVAPTPSPSSEPSADPTSIEIPLPPAEVPDAPELADTGSSTSMLNVLLGAGLLVAGAGAIALGRRRR
ncbi:MAG: LPXTG cell wall anchor domain-containing protein, partial [Propionibacteriales bacterium]|nr:LPXTG cell wall anchor domain-containing protein [Propionibacteriales bacterium]